MTGWWVSDLLNQGESAYLAAWVFWVIVSICLHELGHGYAAIWQGDDTPRELGHITINPLVHMGVPSLVVFAITGYAWGLMPVNPSRFRSGRLGEFLVSGAGPAVNLALALLSLTAFGVLRATGVGLDDVGEPTSNTMSNLYQFLMIGGLLNLVLLFLNLLPVPPLDGSTMVASLSNKAYEFMHHPFVRQAGFFVLILILFGAGVTGKIWGFALGLAHGWVNLIDRIV